MPYGLGNNLETLLVGKNQLSTLPESITQLTKLWQVGVRENPLNTSKRILEWIKERYEKAKEQLYQSNFGVTIKESEQTKDLQESLRKVTSPENVKKWNSLLEKMDWEKLDEESD